MSKSRDTSSGPFALAFPPELIDAIADEVPTRLAANGFAGPQPSSPYVDVDGQPPTFAALASGSTTW